MERNGRSEGRWDNKVRLHGGGDVMMMIRMKKNASENEPRGGIDGESWKK